MTTQGMRRGKGPFAQFILALLALMTLSPAAWAGLAAHEVLVLWTDQSPNNISKLIRDRYLELHPGVHDLNLGLTYVDINSITPTNPPTDAATDRFITPYAFETHVRQVVLNYIEQHELPIKCFVTTRGLPALVTSNFAPSPGAHGTSTGVKASFEGALSLLGLRGPNAPGTFWIWNPYRGVVNKPFDEFVADECIEELVYMASRIDGGNRSGMSPLQIATALLDRSVSLPPVNKFGVTIVVDDNPPNPEPCETMIATRAGAKHMRDARWCVYYDDTAMFLHGEFTPATDGACPCIVPGGSDCQLVQPEVEGQYTAWPELVHTGLGTIHDNLGYGCVDAQTQYECVNRLYVQFLRAHPAGLFTSVESFNGQTLWRGTAAHGDGLHWISYAEGSFAVLNTYGTFDLHPPADAMMLNLYVHGLSWGEASLSSIPRLGYLHTPIGDPLATVQVIDPDIDRDGSVTYHDLLLALTRLEPEVLTTNMAMRPLMQNSRHSLVLAIIETLGRTHAPHSYGSIPPSEFPEALSTGCDFLGAISGSSLYRCLGDLNGDLTVNELDLHIFQKFQPCGCNLLDLNKDSVIDALDEQIVSEFQSLIVFADADESRTVDCADYLYILNNQCTINCDPALDYNCDGRIDVLDAFLISGLMGGCN